MNEREREKEKKFLLDITKYDCVLEVMVIVDSNNQMELTFYMCFSG